MTKDYLKPRPYIVASADNITQLVNQVNAQIIKGYMPLGGPVSEVHEGYTTLFYQAMLHPEATQEAIDATEPEATDSK